MRLSYSGLVCLPSKEDTVSSNLISRSTVNAFTKSFLLQLILDTRIGYLGSFLPYWKFSPYTGITAGVHYVGSDGVVNSDINVGSSYGRICSTGYSKILYFLWLRSPATRNDYNAWQVIPDGDVSSTYYVSVSYGNFIF